jgi:hypothetical protein
MTSRLKLLCFSTFFIVLFAALANPTPARADLGITSVSPSTVVNDIANTLTISGTDFILGAQVSVGLTTLPTTFVDGVTLTASLPAGFPAGVYTLTVTNPGPLSFDLPSALTVEEPTPTATPTASPTATATASPTNTATATSTPTPIPFSRPQMVIQSYETSINLVRYGQSFDVKIKLGNAGGIKAYGIQVVFTSADLLMLNNGGVAALGGMKSGGSTELTQTMIAGVALAGRSMVSADMNISYYDDKGTAFTDKFTLNFPVAYHSGAAAAATATPTGLFRSQLVITNYKIDVDLLQPGVLFQLTMTIKNMGNLVARDVTMIVGGGSASSSSGGTPEPGGVSGGSGEFSNFAPVGSSNIQSLGNFAPGFSFDAHQQMIVNISTSPGAYPMKITFSYVDERGNRINDDQVITLLVYSLPQVDVGFYQPVTVFFAGQPGLLPLQVVNTGKKLAVLGNMKVEADGALIENGEMLVGYLDVGGYFPLDATLTPQAAGSLDVVITIDYMDDFNQPRTITKTLTVQVEENLEPPLEPGGPGEGEIPPAPPETFWQKVWRFILGLFGLDSGSNTPAPGGTDVPVEPVPLVPSGGGKG